MSESYGPKEQYLTDGEEWHHDKLVCHECGRSNVVTNGVIFDCTDCDW